jgi:hypothetical protein
MNNKPYYLNVNNIIDLKTTPANITDKYAVVGTHGVGKTSIVSYLEFYFRQMSKVPEVIPEVARYAFETGIPINSDTTIEAQQDMQSMQKARERNAQNKFHKGVIDTIVCDRGVIDNYVYALYRFGNDAKNQMYDGVMNWMLANPYKKIFKMPLWNINDTLTNDGVRSSDKDFQIGIDNLLTIELQRAGIEYHTLPHEIFMIHPDKQTTELRKYFDEKLNVVRK